MPPKNAIALDTFCSQFDISPTRYRRLANLGRLPQPSENTVDFVRAATAMYKLVAGGDVFLEDWCPESLAMTSQTYRNLAKEGKVPQIKNGMINLKEVMPALIKHYKAPIEEGGGRSLTDEQKRKTRIQADRQELLYLRDKGELISTREASKLWSGIVMTFKVRISAVSRKLAPLVFGCEAVAEIQDIIQRETDAICNELAEPDLKAVARKVGIAIQDHKKRVAPAEGKAKADRKPVGRSRKSPKPGSDGGTREVVHGKS